MPTFASPAQQVFSVLELLRQILSYFEGRDNVSSACVCRAWSDEALNNIWRDVGVRELLDLLAPLDPAETHFARAILPRDWLRFDKYAWRVRVLNFNSEHAYKKEIFTEIALKRLRPLLPHLIELRLDHHLAPHVVSLLDIQLFRASRGFHNPNSPRFVRTENTRCSCRRKGRRGRIPYHNKSLHNSTTRYHSLAFAFRLSFKTIQPILSLINSKASDFGTFTTSAWNNNTLSRFVKVCITRVLIISIMLEPPKSVLDLSVLSDISPITPHLTALQFPFTVLSDVTLNDEVVPFAKLSILDFTGAVIIPCANVANFLSHVLPERCTIQHDSRSFLGHGQGAAPDVHRSSEGGA
ncbi:hypothetical protein IMY05_C4939000200 [Salix suchowensis]|nr:hypothetical protein IMY05_C4939000200 [Salix suchowensis]